MTDAQPTFTLEQLTTLQNIYTQGYQRNLTSEQRHNSFQELVQQKYPEYSYATITQVFFTFERCLNRGLS